MTAIFLVVLALAWAAVILPATLRARQMTPLSAAQRFKRRMRLLAPRTARARYIVVPRSSERVARTSFRRDQRRRRLILQFFVAACALSFVAALFVGGPLWEVQIAFDMSAAIYVALLLEAKRRRIEQAAKVRSLPAPRLTSARDQVSSFEPIRAEGSPF